MKDLDDKLNNMKFNIDVPKEVDDKIQKAFNSLEENKKKLTIGLKIQNFIKILIESIIILVASGNAVAFAASKPNIYSWVLSKIGVLDQYAQYAEPINEAKTSNDITIEFKDYTLDSDLFIVGYNVKLDKETNKEHIMIEGESRINSGDYSKNLSSDAYNHMNRSQICNKISDKEFEVYCLYEVEGEELTENIEYINNIESVNLYTTRDYIDYDEEKFEGKWNFKCDLSQNLGTVKSYKIEDAQIEYNEENEEKTTLKLVQVTDTSIGTIFEFAFKAGNLLYEEEVSLGSGDYYPGITEIELKDGSYMTYNHYIEIRDEQDNIILERTFFFDTLEDVFLKKIDLNKKYKIVLYEDFLKYFDNEDYINNSFEAQSEIVKTYKYEMMVDLSNKKDVIYKYEDVKEFEDVYFEGNKIKIPTIFNYNKYDDEIWITGSSSAPVFTIDWKSIENENLEEMYEKFTLLESYGFMIHEDDEYNIYSELDGEYIGETLSYKELKEASEKGIVKNGNKITKNELHVIDDYKVISKENLKIGNVDAIKFISSTKHSPNIVNYLIVKDKKLYVFGYCQDNHYRHIFENMIKNLEM